MGMALGVAGISFEDFMKLTPAELESVFDENYKWRDAQAREAWEQTRIQTAYIIQPHVSQTIHPADLIPLKWDEPKAKAPKPMDRESQRQRFEKLIKATENAEKTQK